jgi:hypothetical protein
MLPADENKAGEKKDGDAGAPDAGPTLGDAAGKKKEA